MKPGDMIPFTVSSEGVNSKHQEAKDVGDEDVDLKSENLNSKTYLRTASRLP